MVDARVGQAFAGLTRDAAAARLNAAGIAYGFVNGVAELAKHPALRRLVVETPQGAVAMAAPAARLAQTERAYGRVPALGEHSSAIRAEFSAP